jgi:ligand-binding sensor domain-containing protein
VVLSRGAILLALLTAFSVSAAAASNRAIADYHHTAWTSENGLGAVFDIQQAPNGFLWLTTSNGVFRFDGVVFRSVEEVTGGAAKARNVDSVFVSRAGEVWLSTRSAGLLLWKDGELTTFTDRRCTPALKSAGISEDLDGWLWVQGSAGLYRTNGTACEQIDAKWGYPGGFPEGVFADRQGTVWVKTAEGALLVLARRESKFQVSPHGTGATAKHAFLRQAPDGAVWLSDDLGLRRVTKRATGPAALPARANLPKPDGRFGDFAFAAGGSLWAVAPNGVQRFDNLDREQANQAPMSISAGTSSVRSRASVPTQPGRCSSTARGRSGSARTPGSTASAERRS